MMSDGPARILIVEDDDAIRFMLSSYLSREGYQTYEAASLQEAYDILRQYPIRLALIDILLGDGDGLELTRRLRDFDKTGIILISSKSDEVERIIGLEMGADVYICKPFSSREVLAYVKNILRRINQYDSPSNLNSRHCFGDWILDTARRKILNHRTGQYRALTRDEFYLLRAFIENAGRVLSRDTLLNLMHGHDWIVNDRTIDILVGRIRKKLNDGSKNNHITTVYGQGYLFEYCDEREVSPSA